ncbi:hypothetical protein Tco_0443310 [Tanacetum coccineum]
MRLTRQLEILMTHLYVALRIRLRIVLWILVHRFMLLYKESKKGSSYASIRVVNAMTRFLTLQSLDVGVKTSFGFGDQQWKVTKGSLVVAHGNKRDWWFGKVEETFLHNVREDKKTTEIGAVHWTYRSYGPYIIASTLSDPATMIPLSKTAQSFEVATNSKKLTNQYEEGVQVVLVDIPKNLADNDSIVAEHSRSFEDSGRLDEEYSEDGGSSNEGGSETPHERRHHKACGCSGLEKSRMAGKGTYKARLVVKGFQQIHREPFYVGALNDTSTQHKNEGFQLAGQEENLKCRIKEILYGLIQAQKAMMKDRCSEKHVLGYVLTVDVTTVEWESRLQKSITIFLERRALQRCSTRADGGVEEEKLKFFVSSNCGASELIMEDDVLPERGVFRIVCGGTEWDRAVAQPQVNPDSTIAQVEQVTSFSDYRTSCVMYR